MNHLAVPSTRRSRYIAVTFSMLLPRDTPKLVCQDVRFKNLKFVLPYYCRTVCNNVIYWTAFYRESTVPGVWGIPGTKQKYSLTADKYNFQHKFYWTPYGATIFALSTICCPIYAPSCRPDITLMQAYSCPNNCVHMHIEVINKTIINNSWNTIHIDKFKHYTNTGTITLPVPSFLTVL